MGRDHVRTRAIPNRRTRSIRPLKFPAAGTARVTQPRNTVMLEAVLRFIPKFLHNDPFNLSLAQNERLMEHGRVPNRVLACSGPVASSRLQSFRSILNRIQTQTWGVVHFLQELQTTPPAQWKMLRPS
ncbi:unnamed protein product [Linum trigynum]|uniref:Uncharacterized protein n=1 Tax=Linum trigynum TaxID=586398 RepID=A0AAV2DBF9_9ROSI